MVEGERLIFEIKEVEKITFVDDKKLLYSLKTTDDKKLLLDSKKEYEKIYDSRLSIYNKISAIVDFINIFNGNIVISNVRYIRNN